MEQLMFTDNPNFWFETVRCFDHVSYGGAEFGEVLATAAKIVSGDYESWYEQWTATAERLAGVAGAAERAGHPVTARETWLRVANYHRSAEFFLHGNPDDPRIAASYRRAVTAFHRYAELLGPDRIQPVAVPFEGGELPGYFYPSPLPGPRPVLLMHNGFDGTAEECHVAGAVAGQERGYHVLTFDGPGQPGTRQARGTLFRPDWEVPVAAVIDWVSRRPDVDTGRISLLGISLGGELAFRAAAFEPRIGAVIAVDGVYDFGELVAHFFDPDTLRELGATTPERLAEALRADAAPELDAQLRAAMAASPSARWAVEHGMYAMGGRTPREFAARATEYHLRGGIAEKIGCPALVCEAEEDLFFAGQPARVLEHLTTEDRELMVFTEETGADAHCHLGAQRYALGRILDWLDERHTPGR